MRLPALRQDLSLHPGPAELDGAPSWTLHDPAANRFYRLGWAAFELLSRWALGDPQRLLAAVRRETTAIVDAADLMSLVEFLSSHHLFDATGPADTGRLARHAKAATPTRAQWLLKNYLFFRLPLFRPSALLDRLAPFVRWAFDARFWLVVGVTALLGLWFASRQWDGFVHTFAAYTTLGGLLGIGVALSFAKVLHEMGHALTAQRFGCRVPTMGVAFLVMVPVLYTDTNEAWKLPAKRQRLAIAAAGMLSELALAAAATLAWSFLPDGPLRAGAFLLATTTWIVTLGINASPFMRFDGYFLLSDWLDMPNLHARAFALGRWWLRRTLFGWDDPPPERFPPLRHRFLVAFAVVTSVYRLVVFLGIAVLVYRLSFKLLGIFLLAIELGWFIALPIVGELKAWWRERERLQWNRATRRSGIAVAVLFGVLVLPWRTDVRAPAVLGAAAAQGLYVPEVARVTSPPVAAGTRVSAGQVLVQLESPDLQFKLDAERAHARLLRLELERQPFDDDLQKQGPALRERWLESSAAVSGLEDEVARLTVRAPFSGRVVDADDGVVPGAWITPRERLFEVAGTRGAKVEALVGESELAQVRVGSRAVFVADGHAVANVDCRVEVIDRVNVSALDLPYLASTFGGDVAVQKDKQGALVPTEAWYRVHLGDCNGPDAAPAREWRGVAHLQGGWSSIAGSRLRRGIAVVQRELGF